MPDATVTTAIGIIAAVCTTLSFVPQIIKIRRQGARDSRTGCCCCTCLVSACG
jgi:uncharacterized protein with PQ loop repeat